MKKYLTYGLQALLVLFFLVPGSMKLIGNPDLIAAFEKFGYPIWFMYFIGVAEVAGALGIAVGKHVHRLAPIAAVAGLNIIMVGAIISHLKVGDPFMTIIPALVNLVLLNIYLNVLRLQLCATYENTKKQESDVVSQ